MTLDPVLDFIDSELDAAIARLTALLRIPSISTDPAHSGDCQAAADWLVSFSVTPNTSCSSWVSHMPVGVPRNR